jgi:flagellar operon protein
MNQKVNFHHVNSVHPLHKTHRKQGTSKPNTSFREVYQQEINEIKISKHAQKRMDERNIHLSTEQWNKLDLKLNEASQKGIRDSLVIAENAAFVVNANSKTIITALGKDEAQSQIFTNINGAILIN